MKLFNGFALALLGLLPGKLAGEGKTDVSFSMKDNSFFSMVIGSRNGSEFGSSSARLLKAGNTIFDLGKLAAAIFEPEGEGKLRLLLVGVPELVLVGPEATRLWQELVNRTKTK